MTLTNSEKQWIARVMHTISYIAFVESCNNVVRLGQKGVLRGRTHGASYTQRGTASLAHRSIPSIRPPHASN